MLREYDKKGMKYLKSKYKMKQQIRLLMAVLALSLLPAAGVWAQANRVKPPTGNTHTDNPKPPKKTAPQKPPKKTAASSRPVTPVQPTEPVTPVQPTEPVTPVQSTESVTPVQPTEPVTPVQVTEPVTPVQPTEPVTPVQSTEPVTPEQPSAELIYSLIHAGKSEGVHKIGCPDGNHPHMIDLGLPSGTKWACCNLGATTPSEVGDYYRWGETMPIDGDISKYPYKGVFIGKNIAGTKYDAARVNWGVSWRMPTKEQAEELIDNCTVEDLYWKGVNCSVVEGTNGNHIFLPHMGHWLASSDKKRNACVLTPTHLFNDDRDYSHPVRAVANE